MLSVFAADSLAGLCAALSQILPRHGTPKALWALTAYDRFVYAQAHLSPHPSANVVQANAVSLSAELPQIEGGSQKVLYPSSAKAGSDLQVGPGPIPAI